MPHHPQNPAHTRLIEKAPRILRYDPQDYFPEWQSAVRRSFKQLLGLMPARVPLDLQILSQEQHTTSFQFTTEPESTIQAKLHLPQNPPTPPALLINLTPTTFPEPLANNIAILTLNQRPADGAMPALLLGRTLMGERIFDISRALDALTENFSAQLDLTRIAILGNVEAYYAAAFDPRITAALCSEIAPYKSTLALQNFPPEKYIPNLLHYFETSDLAGLIFPRPLLLLAEGTNPLYPTALIEQSFSEIQSLYTTQNNPSACQLITSPTPIPPTALWNTLQALLH